MNYRYCVVYFFFILVFFGVYCTDEKQPDGKKLAQTYCTSCHLFTDPSMLDKNTWKAGVLPAMGERLGIGYAVGEYYLKNSGGNILPSDSSITSGIAFNDWLKIVEYYLENAPETPAAQSRAAVTDFTNLFTIKEPISDNNPVTTYMEIDEGNKRIYAGNQSDSTITVFDNTLGVLSKQKVFGVIVDMHFKEDLLTSGERNGVLTNIGIIYPNDQKTGSISRFHIDAKGNLNLLSSIADKLPRPVQTTAIDLNKDGILDYLVCGFGNNSGSFFYMKGLADGRYEQEVLKALPGSVRSYIDDYNKDGLPDIIVLFAQSEEGIYVYLNKGDGSFEIKELLRFPPIFGSSYFEMVDVNDDGLKDIIYTCGDNSDYSRILKNYHGIYIFLNRGNDQYKQTYFFPIHGCYKARMKDFDKDGDLDIAAISFFPDKVNQPGEAFVYLENKGNLQFTPYTIKEVTEGNWLTMDTGDIDGDGDEDIVIGSLILNTNQHATDKKKKPSFLLLVNRTK